MHSPRALVPNNATTPPGLPGSTTDLSPCAVPNHPGEPGGCSRPLLHHRHQASSRMAAWPLSLCITRPNRVRLRYGSQVRFARLRSADPSAPRWLGYLLNGQLTGYGPFSLQDQPGFSWRSIHVFHVCADRQGGVSCPRVPQRPAGFAVESLGRPPERTGWPGDLALTRGQC
jgi:hypothetical protein